MAGETANRVVSAPPRRTGKGALTGRQLIIEQFLADGMPYMFGNPGTVEQGFLDSLEEYPDFKYILTLQETIAVAMADGHARATGRPALVQLHSGVGLGNGVGMLYQAMRGNAPLVVVAGESGVRYDAMDAQMAVDLVALARPVTKYATRVLDPASLLRVLRRAIKIASTAPMGPVFVALPMDVLDAPAVGEARPTSRVSTRVAPDDAEVSEAARLLADARRPLILMGDGITASGAQAELEAVARRCGAAVWGVNSSEVNLAGDSALFGGGTGHMFGEASQRIVAEADVILICGTYVFPEVFPLLTRPFDEGARVIHIDLNAFEIAKNFEVDLGILADPKLTLSKLAGALERLQGEDQKREAAARLGALEAAQASQLAAARAADAAVRDEVPLRMARFAEELASRLPEDAVIFDEALTNSPALTRYLPGIKPGHFFQTRGGSLGVGIPGALGIKLARPDQTVVAFTGDGGSMYTIQALWTAAHHNIAAKFVILNNQSYMLLKLNIAQYWRERGIPEHEFPASFDLHSPVIDFASLSRSLGVEAQKVERPEQIGPAIDAMLAHDGPFLIDLVLSSELG